ncbi:MAG TPA: quinol:cytochrome C oxidoreductase [Pirellula sp.]|nr:quinol:cytochrome C oxidoreductase [Pirellula sp.]
MNLNYDKASIEIPEAWRAKAPIILSAGLVCLVIGMAFCFLVPKGEDYSTALRYLTHSYLANFFYIFSFALGALFFILMQFLTRAGWSSSIRRLAEILMVMIPYLAVLFVPIILMLFWGSSALYGWNASAKDMENSVVATKAAFYLTKEFFTIRTIVYFTFWILTANWFFRLSRQQDESGDTQLSLIRQKWSGPLIMIFALAMSFSAFDWLMSIDADWYSTIFGVYVFAGSQMGFFAMLIVISMLLQNAGKVQKLVTVEHFHDMGKFTFGFVMFWSYIAFSQLVLIWYANIPEETYWYRVRLENNWTPFSYGLIPIHFVIPFLFLMSRHIRRSRKLLAIGAGWVLFAHWYDITFLVMPNAGSMEFFPMLGHLLGGIGMLCIFAAMFIQRAVGVPLVAMRDPRLPEALSYANPIL